MNPKICFRCIPFETVRMVKKVALSESLLNALLGTCLIRVNLEDQTFWALPPGGWLLFTKLIF